MLGDKGRLSIYRIKWYGNEDRGRGKVTLYVVADSATRAAAMAESERERSADEITRLDGQVVVDAG